MNRLRLIIEREFIAKVRNKSFIMMTFLSPLLMIGMGALVFFLMKKNDEKVKQIIYVDESGMFSKAVFKDSIYVIKAFNPVPKPISNIILFLLEKI